MKRTMLILIALLLTVTAFATTIRDIQYTTDVSGDSPLKNQVVTVSGIVTGEPYAFGGNKMYIQDGAEAWRGVYVYLGTHINNLVADSVIIAEGDSVTITGKVEEYNGLTEITTVTSVVLEEAGVGCPAPIVLTTAQANDEQYEGCLVRVKNAAISNPDAGYGEWGVNDGSGQILIDDEGNAKYYFWPAEYQNCLSITGCLGYSYGAYKIVPRLAWDIVEGLKTGDSKVYTRIQRIQQVRVSDLMKTPADAKSDFSYLVDPDTTLYIQGVVTMPTGLSYAGAGIKFILSDVHGGPWSAILSYNQDASTYPDLFAGDLIEMGGYIGEYSTTPSNMTEFWLVGDINLAGTADLPDTAVITTGDLRHPVTAEQWGNSIVKIENALVTGNDIEYYILEINDGSGSCLVADDSDSLTGYVAPPLMTPIESITGWIYHHYGSYADSTTYNLNPLYQEDIILGEGPAMLLNPSRTPANIPTSSQTVVASVLISTLRNIDTAKVYYRIDNGAYASVDMIDAGENIWSGTLPAQASGSIVEYYYYVVDDSGDVSSLPGKYNEKQLSYKVLDGAPTIYDIQYTHAPAGTSPLSGCNVTFNAYVTTEGSLATTFTDDAGKGVIAVASAPGEWNGVWVLAAPATLAGLHEGDLVTVSGKVDEDHEAYWKWQTNTYVVGTVTLVLSGEPPLDPTLVSLADLAGNPEAYEGVLVDVEEGGEIASVNPYDFTLTDGTNSFLVDDDMVADSILDINYMANVVVGNADTLVAGDSIANVKGVVMYSYGSIKIEVRKPSDITAVVQGPDAVALIPEHYVLHQNYPNPFNPVTTIRFDLPEISPVTLTVYDISGRYVETLVNGSMNAGTYTLRWHAGHLSSGVYFYRIQTPGYTATNKMLLLK